MDEEQARTLRRLKDFIEAAGPPFRCQTCAGLRAEIERLVAAPADADGERLLGRAVGHLSAVHGEDFRIPPEWRYFSQNINI